MNCTQTSRGLFRKTKRIATAGFTLIELLVVITIIAVIAALSVPTVNVGSDATGLTGTADQIRSQLEYARLSAVSDNKTVQFRLFQYANPDSGQYDKKFRGYQLFYIDKEGNSKAMGEFHSFKAPTIITSSPTYSTMVQSDMPVVGSEEIPVGAETNTTASFIGFSFRPNGETDLGKTERLWFMTLVDEDRDPTDAGGLPTDFITIQVDPFNGRVSRWER